MNKTKTIRPTRPNPNKEPPRVIAVDFDGCLCVNRWPNIGAPHKNVIQALKDRQSKGWKLILWTCRGGQQLEEALAWCRCYDLHFDAVNENLPELIEAFGNDPRKLSADEYWDDRAVRVRGDYVFAEV